MATGSAPFAMNAHCDWPSKLPAPVTWVVICDWPDAALTSSIVSRSQAAAVPPPVVVAAAASVGAVVLAGAPCVGFDTCCVAPVVGVLLPPHAATVRTSPAIEIQRRR